MCFEISTLYFARKCQNYDGPLEQNLPELYSRNKEGKRKERRVRFATFVQPDEDLNRAKDWIKRVNRIDFTIEDIKINKGVCENHFPEGTTDFNYRTNPDLIPEQVERIIEPYSVFREHDYFSIEAKNEHPDELSE